MRHKQPLTDEEKWALAAWVHSPMRSADTRRAYLQCHTTKSEKTDIVRRLASRWISREDAQAYINKLIVEGRSRGEFGHNRPTSTYNPQINGDVVK